MDGYTLVVWRGWSHTKGAETDAVCRPGSIRATRDLWAREQMQRRGN